MARSPAAPAVKSLSVMMIGNSFSLSVLDCLPQIAAADPSVRLRIRNAYIGGCTIQRHLREYDATAANPRHRPYKINLPIAGLEGDMASLQECLQAEAYDIVSIQQASPESWRIGSYGADLERLVGIVRQYQPRAEIVAHQTWAYRADDPRILPGGEFKLNQRQMHERITGCYREIQRKYGFRVIPAGNAVDIFRTRVDKPFTEADVPRKPAKCVYPELPPAPNDVVGSASWRKRKDTGEHTMSTDTIHLNRRGRYLQGCVWYMFLFGKGAADVKFIPEGLDPADARFLAQCAEEAIRSWPQPSAPPRR